MNLSAQTRTPSTKLAGAAREQGFIPAELYGREVENLHLSLPRKEFLRALKEGGGTTIITLEVDGKKFPVLIHEVQKDFVSGEVLHVDLYQVQRGQKIKTHVPIELEGEAPAVKAFGGVLIKSLNELEVEALPEDLPHQFVLNVESLDELDKSLHVKDLHIPKGVEVHMDPENVIVSVAAPKEEEEEPPAVESVEDVAVETDEKKAERGEKEEAEG